MATKANTKDVSDNTEEANDAPLAGSGNLADAIKKLLKKGKDAGFVTLDELNAILPPERISSELIEDVMAQLNDMGINVVEGEESDEDNDSSGDGKASAEEDYGRTDDPVRLYLREMGAVELLSREGEIAIAKRIEAGREMMISGICESPLTIQAIVDWNEALKEGRLLLRDIIDLEAMQDTPETASESPGAAAADEDSGDATTDAAVRREGAPAAEGDNKDKDEDGEGESGGDDSSGFEDEDNISLAAIEEKLKPQVIEIFDKIAATYAKLGKLQHQRLLAVEKGEELPKQSDAKIVGYKEQLVDLVRTIRFNNARLEQLVQQLYTLNRRLMGLEGRLLRFGLDVQLTRDEFLERYYGHELDPNWFEHIMLPPPPPKPVEKVQKIAENVGDRLLARAHREREAAAKEKEKADALAAKEQAKREAAEAKAAEKQRLRDEAAAQKQAEADAKARDKAKAEEAKLKEKAKLEAEKAKAKANADKERAKAAAQKERERAQAQKERERAAAQKERERAAAQKERERAAAAKAKAAVKKAPAKPAPAKKPAAKPVAKKAVKVAAKAPAKKAAPAKAAKPVAKKAAAKPAAKKPVKMPAKAPAKSSAKPKKR